MTKNVAVTLYSECVYDVDNRFVDLEIRPSYSGQTFVLSLRDSSLYKDNDSEIRMFLSSDTLKSIIDRLTEVLEDSKKV